jgi:hypothetical protein
MMRGLLNESASLQTDESGENMANKSFSRSDERTGHIFLSNLDSPRLQDWPAIDECEPLPYPFYRMKEMIEGKAERKNASAGLSDERTRFIYSPRSPPACISIKNAGYEITVSKRSAIQPHFHVMFLSLSG